MFVCVCVCARVGDRQASVHREQLRSSGARIPSDESPDFVLETKLRFSGRAGITPSFLMPKPLFLLRLLSRCYGFSNVSSACVHAVVQFYFFTLDVMPWSKFS